jgi:hypothetical protein
VTVAVTPFGNAFWNSFTNLAPYRRACLAAGADAFLDKSTDFDLVAQALVPAAK